MNKLSVLFLMFLVIFSSCKLENKDDTDVKETIIEEKDLTDEEENAEDFIVAGEKPEAEKALALAEVQEQFQNLKIGDTLNLTFKSTVNEVCQNKGCWMKIENGEAEDIMVKFKDYGFFVPKDIAGREVVLSGNAYITEVPVEEQRHFAEDAGKSEEEIAQITEPKRTLTFMADGVLIPQ